MKKVLAILFALLPTPVVAWPQDCCTDVEWAVYRNIPSHIRDMRDTDWWSVEFRKWADGLPKGNIRDAYSKWTDFFLSERKRLNLTDDRNEKLKELSDQVTVGACIPGVTADIPRKPILQCRTMRQ